MRLKETNRDVLKGYRMTKIHRVIDEFMRSDMDCAEIVLEDGEYARTGSAYNGIYNAINRMKLTSTLGVRTINGTVYLFKKECADD